MIVSTFVGPGVNRTPKTDTTIITTTIATQNIVFDFIYVFKRTSFEHNAYLYDMSLHEKERFSCCRLQSHLTYEW